MIIFVIAYNHSRLSLMTKKLTFIDLPREDCAISVKYSYLELNIDVKQKPGTNPIVNSDCKKILNLVPVALSEK